MIKPKSAGAWTLVAGVIGLYAGASLNMEGYLGIVASIATMGAFIIAAIQRNQTK